MLIEPGGAGTGSSDRGTWSWSAASPRVSGERAARPGTLHRDGGHLKMTHSSSHVSGQLGVLLFMGFHAGPRYMTIDHVQNKNIRY